MRNFLAMFGIAFVVSACTKGDGAHQDATQGAMEISSSPTQSAQAQALNENSAAVWTKAHIESIAPKLVEGDEGVYYPDFGSRLKDRESAFHIYACRLIEAGEFSHGSYKYGGLAKKNSFSEFEIANYSGQTFISFSKYAEPTASIDEDPAGLDVIVEPFRKNNFVKYSFPDFNIYIDQAAWVNNIRKTDSIDTARMVILAIESESRGEGVAWVGACRVMQSDADD